MRRLAFGIGVFLATVVVHTAAAGAGAPAELVRAPGWEIAARHCGACHSYRLVTAQRGDARFWTDVIRWMQRTQGLWSIEAEEEATLIAYLAAAYGKEEWGRRPPLSPRLLPQAHRETSATP